MQVQGDLVGGDYGIDDLQATATRASGDVDGKHPREQPGPATTTSSGTSSAASSGGGSSTTAAGTSGSASSGSSGAPACQSSHPVVDGDMRYCNDGDCYCKPTDACFAEAEADACCDDAVLCGGQACTGSHPIVEGDMRYCDTGSCYCGDPQASPPLDVCYPMDQADPCCPVDVVCYSSGVSWAVALLVPVAITLVGGLLATWWRPGERARSWIQHFAAGVVMAVLAVELLPEIETHHRSIWVSLGSFAVAGGLLAGLKWASARIEERRRERGRSGASLGLLVASGIDVLLDGLVIGIGFANDRETGTALAFGLSGEMLFLGVAVGTTLGDAGSRWTPFWVTVGLAGALFVGAAGGALLFGDASGAVVSGGLAFGAGALLYLVTEELLVEAHESRRGEPWGASMLVGGFLLFWGIRRLVA